MTRPICLQGTSGSGPKLFWTPATLASSKRLVYLVQMKRFSPNTIMVQFGGKTKLDFFLLFNPTLLVSLQIIFQNDHLSSSPPLPLQPSYNLFSPGPQQKPLSARSPFYGVAHKRARVIWLQGKLYFFTCH